MSGPADLYAVAANPVAHSLSPRIHARFATEAGQNLHYGRFLVPENGFSACARAFFAAGGRGLNVSVPFKSDAAALADSPSPRVLLAGAANTLWIERGRLVAENTDGSGLVRDLRERHRIDLAGRALILIGAGGAARGVIGPLCEAGVSTVLIANRTLANARVLAGTFAGHGGVSACALDDLSDALPLAPTRRWLVVNASAASLAGARLRLPERLFAGAEVCYDMMYGARPTPFMAQALAAGCVKVHDGLGMLVEQAADAFACWRGVRPRTRSIYRDLRHELAAAAG
ncbi:MAG: shikimate dehydrogenase [Burkholderiaceae bacterium]